MHVPLTAASVATVSRDLVEALMDCAAVPWDPTDSQGKQATTTSGLEDCNARPAKEES